MWQRQATQTHSFNCQLLSWKRQATQKHCVICQDRQHKHNVSIIKLAKTGNTNTLCQLSIVKLEKT